MQKQKPLFVLSPCGTSLLTNRAENVEERKLIGKHANTKALDQMSQADQKILMDILARARECLVQADINSVTRVSAELNGIIKLYNGQLGDTRDYHLLLCTDTWLGEQTALLIKEWLSNKGITVVHNRQPDLQTGDITSFQLALSEIVRWCDETTSAYRKSNYHIVFNLTGGFKSVQGFLQTLAMFYADESIYIFETSKELLRIPRLPVKMNEENIIRTHLTTFRRISMHLPVTDTTGIPETLLLELDGDIAFSPWGEIVWQQTKRKIYEQELHPSPVEKLIFGQQFERSLIKKNLSPDRMRHINERIDQLSKLLELKRKEDNPSSLDFKPLQGNPCPPSTHELDAWADQDAKRMFGHYDNNIFVLDKFDYALH
jgi:putative CRISPR-associated protein (TIGR02619 family)